MHAPACAEQCETGVGRKGSVALSVSPPWRALANRQARVSRQKVIHVICHFPHTLRQSKMASKKLADSTLYHVAPKGFWKKFRTCSPTMETCSRIEGHLCRRRDGCEPRNLKWSPDSFLE